MRDDTFALVFDLGNATLRINNVPQHTSLQSAELRWKVANIEAAVKEVTARGASFS